MTFAELKRLVAAGESERLEFKHTTGTRSEAAKTVCAMLNGLGMEPAKLIVPHESKPWNPIVANVFYRAGVIERTIPDKPQSRFQRYRLTEKGRAWVKAHETNLNDPKMP